MRRIFQIMPIFALLALAGCMYQTDAPASDPSVGTVRHLPNSAPQS